MPRVGQPQAGARPATVARRLARRRSHPSDGGRAHQVTRPAFLSFGSRYQRRRRYNASSGGKGIGLKMLPKAAEDLPRKLGLLDASAIVVGIVIGSGIFVLPNLIARSLPSGPAILGVWAVAGVLSFFGALAYAELGAMLPATGGQYVYLREAYGPQCAFV